VKAELRYLSGARTGQVEVFAKAYIALGRHPLSDARFDADRDLEVSSQHAAILRQGARFVLRDLGSRNGTFVSGQQVTGDLPLADGAVITFGRKGPSVEFHVVEPETPASDHVSEGARASAKHLASSREPIRAMSAPPTGTRPASGSTSVRIAAEVHRQTRHLRRTTKVLLALLVVSAGGVGWIEWTDQRNAREVEALQARADSLNRTAQQFLTRFQSELQSVREALQQSQAEAASLRNELEAAGSTGDPETVARLRGQLDSIEARQRGLADVAGVDYRAISRRNADAVALVVVKFSDVEVFSGTAFAIDSQGTLVTNKHVLAGEDGSRRPLGIAVKFSGSEQWFQGRLLGVADSADVGLLKVDIRGGTPRVAGFAPASGPLQRGDPVAIVGFPLGEDLPMEHQGTTAIADPTLTVGTVSKVLPDLIQIDGYGAPGSSGSPIFDREGLVVGVLYGGPRESHGKIVYAVPSSGILQLLKRVHAAS
jgi:S1-C subfamily serine protease